MPTIKPISELQRNAAAIVKEAVETKEPIYLTKNGYATAVVLDAATYDQQVKAYQQLHADYARAVTQLGRAQADAGHVFTIDELDQQLRERWGDDAF